MRELTIVGALRNAIVAEKALSPVPSRGWFPIIREAFTGAWQRNIVETRTDVLQYPTLYAVIMRIAKDIGKLPFKLMQLAPNGVWSETTNPAYTPVLRKPNHYQTQAQFRESWILSKLMQGNTYALKQRDNRGIVVKLYVLDPCRVQPLVSDDGSVFYELQSDYLSMLPDGMPTKNLTVPAREIIHDREVTLYHPLVGIPPLCAAYLAATKNLRILKSSAEFFGNNAQPSGILAAPGAIRQETADRLEAYWNANFTGENAGKVAVVGDGLKFEALSAKSVDAQMVEQLRYSDEQICQPFGVKPYKIGIGQPPAGWKSDDVNVEYYGDALSDRIEAMENLLDEGLGISLPLGVELDSAPLWRMDEGKQAEVETKLVNGKIKTPDEARLRFNLAPTGGGDTIWGQHQDYPLGMLAGRTDLNPVAVEPPETPAGVEDPDETDKALAFLYMKKSPESFANA